MARSLCHHILERQEIAERDDIKSIVDAVMLSFINILDDHRRFPQMLWRSMHRESHHGDAQQHHHHSSYHEMTSCSDSDHDAENEKSDLFEKVLSLIIVNAVNLPLDGRHHRHQQALPPKVIHLIDCKMQIVLKQCDRWRVDEKSKLIIRHFFNYHFKGLSPFNGTCGGGNGCIIQ